MNDVTSSATATTWSVIQATAPLDAIATTNLVCYGRHGVPHYPLPTRAPDQADALPLCTELYIHTPDNSVRLALLDLNLLKTPQPDELAERQTVWSLYEPMRQMHIVWAWDFYRILSHVVLRIKQAPPAQTPNDAWQAALDAVRAAAPPDTIVCKVQSLCGNINQQHTLSTPPFNWTPAG